MRRISSILAYSLLASSLVACSASSAEPTSTRDAVTAAALDAKVSEGSALLDTAFSNATSIASDDLVDASEELAALDGSGNLGLARAALHLTDGLAATTTQVDAVVAQIKSANDEINALYADVTARKARLVKDAKAKYEASPHTLPANVYALSITTERAVVIAYLDDPQAGYDETPFVEALVLSAEDAAAINTARARIVILKSQLVALDGQLATLYGKKELHREFSYSFANADVDVRFHGIFLNVKVRDTKTNKIACRFGVLDLKVGGAAETRKCTVSLVSTYNITAGLELEDDTVKLDAPMADASYVVRALPSDQPYRYAFKLDKQ